MSRPVYRVRQFFFALRAREMDPADLELVRQYLPRAGVELFETMPLADQRHSLAVLHALLAQGQGRARPLLQAALLHDVAKSRVGLGARTIVILANALSQKILPRLAHPDMRSWRYPFYLSLHHARLGAEMASRAGLDPIAVTLIREHQVPTRSKPNGDQLVRWQRLLKLVDDQN